MHEKDLRALLLVKAIEATDDEGAVLPLADRESATRDTLRAARGQEVLRSDGTLTQDGQRMLVDRAHRLVPALVRRHPDLGTLLALTPGRHWALSLLPLAGLVLGLGLSALDQSRRINILAFPLVGLILWNLAIYVALLVARLKGRAEGGRLASAGHWLERTAGRRFGRFRARVERVHAPLAAALERFGRDWQPALMPMLWAAGRRLMHLTAACVALGLIAGMYVRGLVFRYEAGWESTFLGPTGVERLLGLIYGPAAAITGIGLPATPDAIRSLEWTAGTGGVNAAPWIHLIAVTASLYVVVPRLLLATLATIERVRRSRNAPTPAGLEAYARKALGTAGGHVSGLTATVRCYAYDLDDMRRRGLTQLLRSAFGRASNVEFQAPLAYGDEDEYAAGLERSDAPLIGCLVGVMTLAATPEPENHGVVLTAWRDRVLRATGAARLLFVVDEAPYRERLGEGDSLAPRLEERRELWRSFARSAGVPLLMVDLRAAGLADAPDPVTLAALQSALFPAEQR
jgi:hypothetical protein